MGTYSTPFSNQLSHHPHDLCLEMWNGEIDGDGTANKAFTLLTDTKDVGYASWVMPVNRESASGQVSATVGTAPTVYVETADEEHDVYFLGGYGVKVHNPVFRFPNWTRAKKPGSLIWEIHNATMSSGTKKITCADDLDQIDFPLFVLPIQKIATEPDVNGVGLTEITSLDFTLECGAASAIVTYLVGGYALGGTPTGITVGEDLRTDKPIHLQTAKDRQPGDLIGEIVQLTLGGESPAVEPIVASTACDVIASIEMIIPISEETTAKAVAWNGTKGTTSGIVSANAATDVCNCLVLGYAQ